MRHCDVALRAVIEDRCLAAVVTDFGADNGLDAVLATVALLADADGVRAVYPVFATFFPLMVYKYFEIKKGKSCK